MAENTVNDLKIRKLKDVRVLTRGNWRNFSGHADTYNREGDRNFTISIPQDVAEEMISEGWDIRVREPKSEEYDTEYTLKIRLKYHDYNGNPMRNQPVVYFVQDGHRRMVEEDEVSVLDHASIGSADLVIRQYPYNFGGRSGVSTSLVIGYFKLVTSDFDDPFEDEYLDDSEIPFDAE